MRQDNVFIRLLEKSKEIGLLNAEKLVELENTCFEIENEIERLKKITIIRLKKIMRNY